MGRGGVRVALERYVSTTVFWQELTEYSCGSQAPQHRSRNKPLGQAVLGSESGTPAVRGVNFQLNNGAFYLRNGMLQSGLQ
jgi:hypothetical protein